MTLFSHLLLLLIRNARTPTELICTLAILRRTKITLPMTIRLSEAQLTIRVRILILRIFLKQTFDRYLHLCGTRRTSTKTIPLCQPRPRLNTMTLWTLKRRWMIDFRGKIEEDQCEHKLLESLKMLSSEQLKKKKQLLTFRREKLESLQKTEKSMSKALNSSE